MRISTRKGFDHLRVTFVSFCMALFVCVSAVATYSQELPVAAPSSVGMDPAKLAEIGRAVEQAIADKDMPGAVVLIGHKGKIVYRQAFGNRALVPSTEKMT